MREVVDDLRGKGFKCRNVTVKIRFNDFQTQTRAKTLPEPADDLETLRREAFACLAKFELKKKVRLVGVRAAGLCVK